MNAPHLENGLVDVTPTGQNLVISQANAANASLLRLPAELRIKIWEYALSGNTIRPYVTASNHKALKCVKANFIKPDIHRFSLLQVCRQIYDECAILPYTLCVFSFQRMGDVLMWMDIMAPHEIALVRNIRTLRFRYKRISCLRIVHDRFPGLEEIKLHLDTYYDDDMGEEEQKKYEECYEVAVEVIHTAGCDWHTQWATDNLDAKCQACKELDDGL